MAVCAMSGAGLHVFGGEVWLFSGDVVEVAFEGFEGSLI